MLLNSVIFLASSPTCHGNSLHHSHIAWGWTTLMVPDETELKLDQLCLSAPRPASDWLWSWKLNPVVFCAITHTRTCTKRWIHVCIFCPQWSGNKVRSGWIGQPVDDTTCVSQQTQVMRWMLWPKPSTKDQRPVYTQQNSDDDEEDIS